MIFFFVLQFRIGLGVLTKYSRSLLSNFLTQIQATSGPPRRGAAPVKKFSAREKQQQDDLKEEFTEQVMEPLPKLLSKFGLDKQKVVLLLQLPRHFDLATYAASRNESNFDQLLTQLSQILEKNALGKILEEVAETLSFFTNSTESVCTKVG